MKRLALVLKLLTDRMPRKAAIASLVMIVTFVVFAVLFFVLGGAHDDAIAHNEDLKQSLDKTTRDSKQAREDLHFMIDNQAKYEELIHGERLIPHTRNVALEQLGVLQKADGLTTLSFNFTAVTDPSGKGAAAVTQGGYKVQTEKVDLKIGAPLDTQVYDFLLDLGGNFPGSAVVDKFSIERSGEITTDALNQVSRNHESGLVKGEVHFSWHTAQAQEDDKKNDAAQLKARK